MADWYPMDRYAPGDRDLGTTETPIPQSDFPFEAYGVRLNAFGDEGGMIAPGRVGVMRFTAACQKVNREHCLDCFPAGWDAEDALDAVSYCRLAPAAPPYDGYDWWLESAGEGTPGAAWYTVVMP